MIHDTRPKNFPELKKNYSQELISRDEYWRQARTFHEMIAKYSETIEDSNIENITITKDELIIKLKSGVKLLWNPLDIRSSANTIINHGSHEADDGKYLLAAAKNCRYIMDIGANAGYYALHFGLLYSSTEKIYAFEPIQSTFETLKTNIAINHLEKKISAINVGLGNYSGEANFFVPSFSGSCAASMLNLHPNENNSQVQTNITTLDQYCEENLIKQIDLMKIDVEGSEFFVLQGAFKILESQKPTLFIEILRKWSRSFGIEPNQTFEMLKNLGYKCWVASADKLSPFQWMTEETTETNFFFTHPSRISDPNSTWKTN